MFAIAHIDAEAVIVFSKHVLSQDLTVALLEHRPKAFVPGFDVWYSGSILIRCYQQ